MVTDMTKIFLVSVIDMEPYSDYSGGPSLAFTSKEKAEKFIKDHDQVYGEGYFKWDEKTEEDIPCSADAEDAIYEHGWKYSSYIDEIELVE